jgi:hypothetical protein
VKRRNRAWKKIDQSVLLKHFANNATSLNEAPLTNREEIDSYVAGLTQAISASIDASTPWLIPSPHSQAYWPQECFEAIYETRRLRRIHTRLHTLEAWNAFTKARNRKGNLIAKAKRAEFRESMRIASESQDGIWRIAKWAKQRALGIHSQVSFPSLRGDSGLVHSPKQKAELLRKHLFPPPPQADLSDTIDYAYPEPITLPAGVEQAEVMRAIRKSKKDSAPGPDEIPNRVLQLLASDQATPFVRLFDACYRQGICPTAFKSATTVILHKHR